jgi:hypothetical protein
MRCKHNDSVAQRIPRDLERTILSIRRRLQAHATPATCYRLIGADAILAELKALSVRPLAGRRTIERVLQRNGLTAPRVRLARLLPRQRGTLTRGPAQTLVPNSRRSLFGLANIVISLGESRGCPGHHVDPHK